METKNCRGMDQPMNSYSAYASNQPKLARLPFITATRDTEHEMPLSSHLIFKHCDMVVFTDSELTVIGSLEPLIAPDRETQIISSLMNGTQQITPNVD